MEQKTLSVITFVKNEHIFEKRLNQCFKKSRCRYLLIDGKSSNGTFKRNFVIKLIR